MIKKTNILFFILFFILSCKTKNNIKNTNFSPKNSGQILSLTKNNFLEYENLSIKFKVNYKKEEQSLIFSGNLRILKDKKIWLSLRAFGFPVASALFTNDSLKIVDKFNKKYFVGNYDFLEKQFNQKIDFQILQAILTNEFFKTDKNQNLKKFEFLEEKNFFNIFFDNKNIYQKFIIKDKIFKIENIEIFDKKKKKKLFINYGEFKNIKNKIFPNLIKIKLENQEEKENIFINVKYTNIVKNKKNLKFNFKIPKKYKKF